MHLGKTDHNELVAINRRCVESDLLIYVNINLVPMDGGHKSVAVGLCDYETLRAHHNPKTIRDSDSYMDPKRSELNEKVERLGALVDQHLNVFHIETALNNRMFDGADRVPAQERGGLHRVRPPEVPGDALHAVEDAARREAQAVPRDPGALRGDRACYAGKTEPVHEKIAGALLGAVRACRSTGRPTS